MDNKKKKEKKETQRRVVCVRRSLWIRGRKNLHKTYGIHVLLNRAPRWKFGKVSVRDKKMIPHKKWGDIGARNEKEMATSNTSLSKKKGHQTSNENGSHLQLYNSSQWTIPYVQSGRYWEAKLKSKSPKTRLTFGSEETLSKLWKLGKPHKTSDSFCV